MRRERPPEICTGSSLVFSGAPIHSCECENHLGFLGKTIQMIRESRLSGTHYPEPESAPTSMGGKWHGSQGPVKEARQRVKLMSVFIGRK